MAPIIGKRKRRERVPSPSDVSASPKDDKDSPEVQSLFRQHFEANFEPLEEPHLPHPSRRDNVPDVDLHEQTSDWEGLSDSENDHVEVVDHAMPKPSMVELVKEDFKSFMV